MEAVGCNVLGFKQSRSMSGFCRRWLRFLRGAPFRVRRFGFRVQAQGKRRICRRPDLKETLVLVVSDGGVGA